MKKILSMILLLCAAFSVEVRGDANTVPQDIKGVYIIGEALWGWGNTQFIALDKTSDSPRTYEIKYVLKKGYFRFHTNFGTSDTDNVVGDNSSSIRPANGKVTFGTAGTSVNIAYAKSDDYN